MLKKYLAGFVFVALFFVQVQSTYALAPVVLAALTTAGSVTAKILTYGGYALKGAGALTATYCTVNLETCASGVVNYLFYWIISLINMFLSWLVWITAWMMDYVLYYTVAQFTPKFLEWDSSTYSASEGGLIYYAWSIVRDLLNAGVFFIVIYHAIRAMLNGFEDIKKKFVGLLVFVVCVNFSLLFVKLVADVSNIAILQLYNAAAKPLGSETREAFLTHRVDGKGTGLSVFVLNAVNPMSSLAKDRVPEAVRSQVSQNVNTFGYQFGLMLTYVYLFFLFIYITAILFTRAVTFIVVMIASPLLVAGWFFSGFEKKTEVIKNELFEEAFQGPGIVFFLILSGMVASSLFTKDSFVGTALDQKGAGVIAANLPMFLKFFIFGAFNYYAFSFVRELTANKNNFSEKLAAWGIGAGLTGAAFGAKWTLGLGAQKLGSQRWLTNAAKEKGVLGGAARFTKAAANWTSTRGFDVRGKTMGTVGSLIKTYTGINTGNLGEKKVKTNIVQDVDKIKESWKKRGEAYINYASANTDPANIRNKEVKKKMADSEDVKVTTSIGGNVVEMTSKQATRLQKGEKVVIGGTTYDGTTMVQQDKDLLEQSKTASIEAAFKDDAIYQQTVDAIAKDDKKKITEAIEKTYAEGSTHLTEKVGNVLRHYNPLTWNARDKRRIAKGARMNQYKKTIEDKVKVRGSSSKVAQKVYQAAKTVFGANVINTATAGLTQQMKKSLTYLQGARDPQSDFVLNYISNPDPTKKKSMDKDALEEHLQHINNASEAILLYGHGNTADSLKQLKEAGDDIEKEIEKLNKIEKEKKEAEEKKKAGSK